MYSYFVFFPARVHAHVSFPASTTRALVTLSLHLGKNFAIFSVLV